MKNEPVSFTATSRKTGFWCMMALGCALGWTACTDSADPVGDDTDPDELYLDPTHPSYMSGPTRTHFPDSAKVFLEPEEYAAFQSQLRGFLETNNEGEYARHFRDFYIPEIFPSDSVFDLYVTMWWRWDSIGVTNRFDHWTLRYVSPFSEGPIYDMAVAEVDIRHHMVFEKRWTGNYRNFGRTLGERYPGATLSYMDTTYVDAAGDTLLKRHITAEASRLLYAVRGRGDSLRGSDIRWLNDGWQLLPELAALMDSAAVAQLEEHRQQFGTLKSRPVVSGR